MPSDAIIRVRRLRKDFRLYARTRDRILELFLRRQRHTNFVALQDIDLELSSGETVGIIGENGSGKSTLLKLVAGILLPSAGSIERNGKITGLLELGTGFNPELSGRRNIYLNGVYLNMSKEQMRRRERQIVEFAELGEFIDQPLKNYSSGMAMRLGFAIAIHADPQCFIIDEALSVGDARFQQKCFARLARFRQNGGSILFVSHDLNAIRLICDRTLLLDHGRPLFLGNPEEAVNRFNKILADKGESGQATQTGYGNGDVYFQSAWVEDAQGEPATAFISGQAMRVCFKWGCRKRAQQVTFGLTIRDRFGQDIFGTNGALLNVLADINQPGEGYFYFPALDLGKGEYTISLAAHTGTTHLQNCYHWWDNAAVFEVREDINYRFGGIARLQTRLVLRQESVSL